MKIRLKEIPSEGRDYTFDRESGELNVALKDIVGDYPFDVTMNINPIGSAYEMRGTVKTSVNEVCSVCGYDFKLPIDRRFHEILIEEHEEHRKAQSVHGNQAVDFLGENVSMTTVKGSIFEPGDFVHETIALAVPFYPTCGPEGTCLRHEEAIEIRKRLESETAAFEETAVGHPAFDVLKGLDVKKGKN